MEVEALHKNLYRITTPFDRTGVVFLYLFKGDTVALVDTGSVESPGEVLRPALAQIGLALSDVDLILNTHAHLDHSGGNSEVKAASNAQIHLHKADLFMAQSTEAEVEYHTRPLRTLEFPEAAVKARADHVLNNVGRRSGADVLHEDGDVIDLGNGVKLRVVHCPGHTPGHVCYYWESEGIALTGDSIQGIGARPGSYPYYFYASDYRRSVAKMIALNPHMLCLGHAYHGGTLVNDPCRVGAKAQAFMQASIDTADTIHHAVVEAMAKNPGAGKREIVLAALSDLLYRIPQLRLPETNMPLLAGPTLLSHLEAATSGSYPD